MMDVVLEWALGLDLTGLHLLLCLVGMAFALYWAGVIAHDPANLHVPPVVIHLRRYSLGILALGFLACAGFAIRQSWSPWPPVLIVFVAVDLYIAASVLAAHARMKACGKCPFVLHRAKRPDVSVIRAAAIR